MDKAGALVIPPTSGFTESHSSSLRLLLTVIMSSFKHNYSSDSNDQALAPLNSFLQAVASLV